MTVMINGKESRIGLALSGGGFRAAAFHLGMLRKLHAFQLLQGVDLLTCVSGGSIAGASLSRMFPSQRSLERWFSKPLLTS
jgi:NTE family protein